MSTYTTVKLGYSDPRTDAFGAHPLLGAALDLNDGATFTVVSPDGLELSAPEKTLVPTGNVRTQGERVTRAIYQRNRTAVVRLIFGPAANYAAFIASVRSLVRWLDAPPATPLTIQWQPPSATSPVYLDVVGAAHGIPADEREWLRLQVEPIEIVFLVRPGLRGDRVTLSNLVTNPGFEAPSGPAVSVFYDTFANADAYTVLGSAPSVTANVMTIPANTTLLFGSTAWGALNRWQVRFQWQTGASPTFDLHYTDSMNNLYTQYYAPSQTFFLVQYIAGTGHTLASSGATALTAGNWYWMVATQFPAAPGEQPAVKVTFYNDSGGAIGSQVVALGPIATYDGVTALSGQCGIWSGPSSTSLAVGGAFAGVNQVELFGPGGWYTSDYAPDATYAHCGYGWEQATANTYPGGAVTSYGAARVDIPPAGFYNAAWTAGDGSSLAALRQTAIAVAAGGNTLGVSVALKATGLTSNGVVQANMLHYDASGAFLSTTFAVVTHAGATAGWVTLAASYVTPANTAYVALQLVAYNGVVAGADAGGIVWYDNAQVWNETTTGQATMPYCELRFAHSPAQLLVTGLLGDLPAPAHVAWGTYLASWPLGSTLTYALGRRAQASANARLAATSHGFYGTALSPTATPALDASAYGGYYPAALVNPGWNPRAFSFTPSDLPGVFHLFTRFWTAQLLANLGNVSVRVTAEQKTHAWYGDLTGNDDVGEYYGPYVSPISAASTWTVVDAGQVNVPLFPAGALTDLTATYLSPRSQWADTTAGGSTCRSDWQMLQPVDGSLLVGLLNNPSNAGFSVTAQWLWAYHDGLLVNRAAVGDAAATTYSLEASPASNPSHGAGGPGTQSTGVININSGADPYLTLDPTVSCASTSTAAGGAGVNQLAGYVADNAGAVLPLHVELRYSPLYLYPR